MRAHAPGSVTTLFAPNDDPNEGSLGVSFAVADGVVATVGARGETRVTLDGTETAFDPVERVLADLGVRAAVDLEAAIPVGCGFGASGAATLATALAANDRFDLGRDRESLVAAAHRAEVAAGTGLGDVFVQDRGGLVWNVGDGVERTPCAERVEYATFGGIATSDVLGDEASVARVRGVGRETLAAVEPTGSFAALLDASWTFAERTDLRTEPVAEAVERVERAGGTATMAMVGETVVATGAEGVLEGTTRATETGARVLSA
jgi:pantoate kinase